MPTAIVTHKYEFPSENPIATFGAGWTLAGSVTRPLFFKVGDSLDDIITQFNGWQDVGTETPLTKTVVLHQIEYRRKVGTDTVTITYPTISNRVDTAITVSGSITTAERSAFLNAVAGTEVSGWVVTNKVHHAVVTLVATTSRKVNTSTNPRFLSGLEAIDYVRTPTPLDPLPPPPPPPPPPVTVPGAPVNIYAELLITTPTAPSAVAGIPLTSTSASVEFVAPANDGGSAITGYTVTSTPGGVTATGTTSPIVVNGLTGGETYTFTVHATNAAGNSVESPPSSPITMIIGDPYFANVALLLHGDGNTNDSSSNTKTTTASGGAAATSLESVFGGSSIFFDGVNDNLFIPSHPEFEFGTGDFTIEFWYKQGGAKQGLTILRRNMFSVGGGAWGISVSDSGTNRGIYWLDELQGGVGKSTTSALSTNVWGHYAVCRSNGVMQMFIDGISYYSGTNSNNYSSSLNINIGNWDQNNTVFYSGYLDDLRITTGIARYTANFTVPTAPFPDQ